MSEIRTNEIRSFEFRIIGIQMIKYFKLWNNNTFSEDKILELSKIWLTAVLYSKKYFLFLHTPYVMRK